MKRPLAPGIALIVCALAFAAVSALELAPGDARGDGDNPADSLEYLAQFGLFYSYSGFALVVGGVALVVAVVGIRHLMGRQSLAFAAASTALEGHLHLSPAAASTAATSGANANSASTATATGLSTAIAATTSATGTHLPSTGTTRSTGHPVVHTDVYANAGIRCLHANADTGLSSGRIEGRAKLAGHAERIRRNHG